MNENTGRLIGLGLMVLIVIVYYAVRAVREKRSTGSTLGTVIETGYKPHSHYIRFAYTVDGRRYEGRAGISGLQVSRFEPGLQIRVSYDPSDPAKYYVPDPYYL